MDKDKVLIAILALLAISSAVGYQYFRGEKNNYFDAVTETYQAVEEIQSDLSIAAGNLSASDAGTVENFIGKLNSSKDILLGKNNSFSNIDVPGKFEDDNKKLLECLKTEYNLINRWRESVSITNEYEAAENFTKSKDLMQELKEKSAMLSIEGNNFENIFDLAATYGKIEKYLNAQKQLRYDKDTKEQAEREKIAAEKARQEAAAEARRRAQSANDIYCGTGNVTGWRCYAMIESFRRYNGVGNEYCRYTATLKMITQQGNTKYLDYVIHVGNFPAWFENSNGFSGRITSETNVEQNLLTCLLNHYGD